MTPRQAISKDWTRHLSGGPIGVGLDLATTQNKKSNPSALVVSQMEGRTIHERLVVRWKTNDDRVTKGMLAVVFADLTAMRRRARGLGVDASNEKFLCQQIKRAFSKFCRVHLIASGEVTQWKGEELTWKVLLGNLYSGLYEQAAITHPNERWIIDDRFLVKRDKGSFAADLGPNGEHGDTFDAGKLAYWPLLAPGRAELAAVPISGSEATGKSPKAWRHQLKNWLARRRGPPTTNV